MSGGQPIGELNWGTPLNAELTADETQISANSTAIANHVANVPSDPHGDRAYAAALVNAVTTGTNGPSGYVTLDSHGKIPLGLIPVGAGLTNWIDVIPDYSVPTNGTSDASATINAALSQTNLNGGGIVYVGNGTFGLANPLLMYANTWLICSPGAIFQRINLITPPFAMIQNYGSGIIPGGNIRVTGGTWNVASLAGHSGAMFSFAAANNILVEDCQVVAYPDGLSPIGQLFGCTDVTIENVSITAAAPITSGRGNQHLPCFRVEECNSTNLPGLPNVVYTAQECSDISVINVSLNGQQLSDSFGGYTAWTSFCGTKGTMTSGSLHVNISVTGGCYGTGFAVAAVEVLNWSNLTCSGNFFTYPKTAYTATWSGVSPQVATFIFDVNSPRSYAPATLATCSNTLTETIVAQFQVPANDWIPGTTCYRHRHSGIVSTAGSTDTLVLSLRCGSAGTTADTLIETITVTVSASQTNVPYTLEHCGFDIDGSGNWHSAGWRVKSPGFTVTVTETISATIFTPTAGQQLYFSHTLTWGHARSGQTCTGKAGCHERANL